MWDADRSSMVFHLFPFLPTGITPRGEGTGGGLLPVGRLWAGSFKPVLREEKGGGETRGGHFIEILCVGRM